MSSRYCCRWKIFFLIFSLVFRTPAISFTIGRSSNLTADLLGEESSQLEVKHGLKSSDVRNDNVKVFDGLEDSLPSQSSVKPAKNTGVLGTASTVTESTETLTIQNNEEITEPYISAAEVIKPRHSEVTENLASNNDITNDDFNSFLLVNTTVIEKNNELQIAVTESVTSRLKDINEMETLIGVGSTNGETTALAETTEVTSSDISGMKINGTYASQNLTKNIEILSERIESVGNVTTNKPTEVQLSDKTEKMVTKNTRVTLEETSGTTSDIPSLEQLKNDFIALTRKLPTENPLYVNGFSVTDPFITTKKIPDTTNTISILILTNKTKKLPKLTTPKTSIFENMSAKMGGFMNISSEKNNTVEATTSVAYTDAMEVKLNETEMYGNMFEMEMDEGVENKNSSGAESQSQLVDDAIKEELLIEETLSDNKENNHKRLSQENVTEQRLIVKPIPRESDKKSIYTVSPLYKPLNKKVFLPSKPFMRDPDDNSWRNESLSSLGITFKAKNSSKPFTQVLKNKTEMELKNILEKENKIEDVKQELRQRLEKMAELRKLKKKKFDDGTYYNDYEESNVSIETTVKPKSETLAITAPTETTTITSTTAAYPPNYLFKSENFTYPTTYEYDGYSIHNDVKTTKSPKKFFNAAEYYDTNDDGDVDYMTGIDLKKFTIPFRLTNTRATPPATQTMKQNLSERKATVQYYPPKTTQKVNINDYDNDFQRKVNSFTVMETPKNVMPVTFVPSTSTAPSDGPLKQKQKIMDLTYNPLDLNRDLYFPQTPQGFKQNEGYTIIDRDQNLDKNSYIIKPYRNYFNEVAKEHDSERTTEYIPTFTPLPMRGVTADDTSKTAKGKFSDLHVDYEYDVQFRKDIFDRFADNFNQHRERYKVDFPVIYNNSVIHKKTSEDGKVVASSSAFMRRLYDLPSNKYELNYNKPYDPNCDNVTVELSPAYELHYYVPDEEEKEILDPRSTLTYAFRL